MKLRQTVATAFGMPGRSRFRNNQKQSLLLCLVFKLSPCSQRRYRKLLANVEQSKVFKKDAPIKWKCRNCGYVFEGSEAPEKCPVCDHPRSFFEVWCENY